MEHADLRIYDAAISHERPNAAFDSEEVEPF